MSPVRWEKDSENIVTLTFDAPGSPVNTMTAGWLEAFEAAVGRIVKKRDAIAGVVLASAKKTFFAGAELKDVVRLGPEGGPRFFEEVERYRYAVEYFIPRAAEFEKYAGRRVLEIGVGLGTDSSQFAKHGAEFWGMDLTPQCVSLSRERFRLFGLRGRFQIGSATALPFPDASFDHVYSWGVLLTVPNIGEAVREIHRVLRPGGTFTVMLYHRDSWNYWVTIRLLRRIGFALIRRPWGIGFVHALTGYDRNLLRRYKLSYDAIVARSGRFTSQDLLNESTDGPGHPYSTVWSRGQANRMFSRTGFADVRSVPYYFMKKNVPVLARFIPDWLDAVLGRFVGFFLVTKGRKPAR